MASWHAPLRPQPPSSAANHPHFFATKIILLLTLLPLSLAVFAFVLLCRGGGIVDDPISRWSPDESHTKFLGMDPSHLATTVHTSSHSSDCSTLLGQMDNPVHCRFLITGSGSSSFLKPKICITTSTSADLDQILLWVFYHKVIGVSSFFLFDEGKAASPSVSKVLESIPAIIRGLRESGVFSSVISSAEAILSKDKFLASIDSSNSSVAVAFQSHPSRKIGRNRESQATARRTLEMTAFASHEAAVPPLSPPSIDNDLMIEA